MTSDADADWFEDKPAYKQPSNTRTGFWIERSESWEAEKREREVQEKGVIATQMSEPVWEPSDPRWLLRPPYGFRRYLLKYGGRCMYCGEHIGAGFFELYSAKVKSVAHIACHADFDREMPP